MKKSLELSRMCQRHTEHIRRQSMLLLTWNTFQLHITHSLPRPDCHSRLHICRHHTRDTCHHRWLHSWLSMSQPHNFCTLPPWQHRSTTILALTARHTVFFSAIPRLCRKLSSTALDTCSHTDRASISRILACVTLSARGLRNSTGDSRILSRFTIHARAVGCSTCC